MIIKLLVEGGEMKPGPIISQKLGPLGINIGKIISDINEATKNFKGLKVPVELDIEPSTKKVKINVLSPPVTELIKKELGIEKGSGEQKKVKVGNLSIEQIIKIAKIKYPNMLANNLKAAVKTVLGSCVSLGVFVESKDPKEIIKEVEKGVYDKEINEEKTEPSKEKLQKLKEFFEEANKKQQEIIKKEQEAAAQKEETKSEETSEKKEQ